MLVTGSPRDVGLRARRQRQFRLPLQLRERHRERGDHVGEPGQVDLVLQVAEVSHPGDANGSSEVLDEPQHWGSAALTRLGQAVRATGGGDRDSQAARSVPVCRLVAGAGEDLEQRGDVPVLIAELSRFGEQLVGDAGGRQLDAQVVGHR
jgi:hypothetical protein